jgi:hypothetical protein
MYRVKRTIIVVAILVLLSLPEIFAVTVTPTSQQLSSPTDDVYTFVYSVVNNDPRPRSLNIQLEPHSEYLREKVTFSKEQFALLPGATENVQVSIHPAGLGPETHALRAGIYDAGEKLATLELLVTIPGTPMEKYGVQIDARDTTPNAAVPISVTLNNYGNIIGYGQLVLEIQRGNTVVGTLTYPELVQVLPGKELTYDLVFTESLDPGFYAAQIRVDYPSGSVNATDQFSVELEESTQRITPGSDLILTFASIGNPPKITYALLDENQKEQAAGTFLPQSGDIVIPMAQLPVGTYHLYLSSTRGEQHITIVVKNNIPYFQYAVIAIVIVILLYAAYSYAPIIRRRYRLYQLERAIAYRQEVVINLINRSHRLVDEYTALHARRRQTSGSPGTPNKGP